ncbi:MAG: nucleotidyltransferase family protein [Vulcanimicrobiota bacterium]
MISSKSDLSILLLAGGLGSRLQSVIPEVQKVAAEINGKPFINYLLEQISALQAESIFVCAGHKAEMLKEKLCDTIVGVNLKYSIEDRPLGTGGAVRLALPKVDTPYVMIMNGDSYTDFDLTVFLDWFMRKQIEAGILLTEVENVSRYGYVELGENERVLAFEEKGGSLGRGWINAGVYLFHRRLLQDIPQNVMFSLEKELLVQLVEKKKLYGYPARAAFIDIGTPESFREADSFLKGLSRND